MMLETVKTALRLTTTDLDGEVRDLIDAALLDLSVSAGVDTTNADSDKLIRRAVITYCRANFFPTADTEKLKASYDEQKAQLKLAAGYGYKP